MKKHQHDETLYHVGAETLESLAMMYLVSPEEAVSPPPACDNRVAVTFTGPFNGVLVLAASQGVLPALAANMLGLEDEKSASPEQQTDAFKELVNVICGNLLPALAGKEVVFHISVPYFPTDESLQKMKNMLPAGKTQLFADTGVLELNLFVHELSPLSA